MIVVNVKQPGGDYFDPSELDNYETDRAKDAGVDVLVYSYQRGSYEGSGAALLRKNGMWAYADLGHRSCYGPLDTVPDAFEPLEHLRVRMSKELRQETEALFAEVTKRGWDLA
jgi:hypothetical protein